MIYVINKMPLTVDPALVVDQAVRAEILGRPGIEFQGKMRTSAEIRRMAGSPVFPLAPFNEALYYQNKMAGNQS
jgi:hypothetical protein